jgi:hypothetical protein
MSNTQQGAFFGDKMRRRDVIFSCFLRALPLPLRGVKIKEHKESA